MSPFVLSFFNSILFAIYSYVVGTIILKRKKVTLPIFFRAFIPFLAMYYCILCLVDSIYSIFFSGICLFWFIRIIFKENTFMSLFISLVIHTIKVIFKIIIITILNNDSLLLIHTYETLDLTAFYINIISMLLSVILVFILKKPLKKLIKFVSSLNHREIVLLFSIYISFILITIFQRPNNLFTLETFTDFLILFTVTGMAIFNISSEKKMELLMNYYKEIFDYSKANEELLYKYKMQVHENKNKLIMIRGLLDVSKKDTKKYIENALKEINDDKSNSNYWLTELKYIPLPGVRNFINYKLIKLKKLGAEIEVFVSSELEKLDTSLFSEKDYSQLTTILGVVLDNMIESIKETKEKLISINIYLEDDIIHAEFVNSFSGEIDISRLNEVGYTTKGEQHGVGLPLVAKITKMNDRFECKPKIMDNFFIQHLTIKLCNKNNLQKNTKK